MKVVTRSESTANETRSRLWLAFSRLSDRRDVGASGTVPRQCFSSLFIFIFSLSRYFGKNSKPGTDYLVDNLNKSLHREPVHGSILVQQAYGN